MGDEERGDETIAELREIKALLQKQIKHRKKKEFYRSINSIIIIITLIWLFNNVESWLFAIALIIAFT